MAAVVERQFSTTREDCDEETLDPRVQVELEKLNKSSDDINKLELELDEARSSFRQVLTESTQRLNALSKKLGSCIEKARPYYEARMKAKEAQIETQNVALRFERACSQQAAAKEMVFLAEQGFFKKGQPFDPAWQEMLNHATIKVNDAERERLESEIAHQVTAKIFNECEQRVKRLQKDLKRNIAKSRPYFEMKAKFNHNMEEQKKRVSGLEEAVVEAKKTYSEALNNLEKISDSIHQQRKEAKLRSEMGDRGSGVGAEAPAPPVNGHRVRGVHVIVNRTNSQTQTESEMLVEGKDSEETFMDPLGCKPCNGIDMSPAAGSKKVVKDGERGDSKQEQSSADTLQSKTLSPPTSPLVKRAVNTRLTVSNHQRPDREKQFLSVEECETVSETVSSAADIITPGSGPSSAHTTAVTSPETETEPDVHVESTKTNMEIMDSLQKAKNFKSNFLRPNRSRDDLLEEASDSESIPGSMASVSVLDDDQIENLMIETGEFVNFLAKHEDIDGDKARNLTLPAKLSYLQNYMSFKPELVEAEPASQDSTDLGTTSTGSSHNSPKISLPTASGDMVDTVSGDDMAAETQTLTMADFDSCWSSEICSEDIAPVGEGTWQNVLHANSGGEITQTVPLQPREDTVEGKPGKSFIDRGRSLEEDSDFQRVYQELSAFEKLMHNSSSSEDSPPRSIPTGQDLSTQSVSGHNDKDSEYKGDPLGVTQVVTTRNLEGTRASANSSPIIVNQTLAANSNNSQAGKSTAEDNTEYFV